MSKRFRGFLAALALALGLQAPGAVAGLIVTATSPSGYRGDSVDVTLAIVSDGDPDEVNLAAIGGYTFNFLWNPEVLAWTGHTSTVNLSGSGPTFDTGKAAFVWIDPNLSNSFSVPNGLSITATFKIQDLAAYAPTPIRFYGSTLDENLDEYPFVRSFVNFPATQVTVLPSTPMPEPTALSMLLAGLGIMAFVRRRGGTGQA